MTGEIPSKYGHIVFENNGLIAEAYVCKKEDFAANIDPVERAYYLQFLGFSYSQIKII